MNNKSGNYLQNFVDNAKRAKDRFLSPLAKLLIAQGVSANHVSIVGGIVGLCAVIGLQQSTALFLLLAFTWRIIDMIDGTVSRETQQLTWWIDPLVDRVVGGTYLFTFAFISGEYILYLAGIAYIIFSTVRFLLKIPTMLFPEDIFIILYFFGLFSTAGILILICSIWNLKETIIYTTKCLKERQHQMGKKEKMKHE